MTKRYLCTIAIALALLSGHIGISYAATDNAPRLEECRTKLKAAAKIDLVKNLSFKGGSPKLWVGRTWYRIDVSAKTGLAETAACFFLAGKDAKQKITLPIYDGSTGKQIATWEYTRLVVR